VDSCKRCDHCKRGLEQFCPDQSQTYNGLEQDKKTPTYGGYSKEITVNEDFVLHIPSNLPLDKTAPLLCAGITMYSPLRNWKAKPGDQVAILGLGGLGHVGVKIAAAMGTEVTVISTSDRKKDDAFKFGAKHFLKSSDPEALKQYANRFDLIINTVAADLDVTPYLNLLKVDGTLVQVAAPEKPSTISVFPLILGRRSFAGSMIGGIAETQEMLNFCGEHNITSDIELIQMDYANQAYDRVTKSDVRYRFVIDIHSL